MALRNTTRKTTALVPAAAPIIVQALRAGPLTTQELWAKCISDNVQNAGSSQQAGEGGSSGADKLGLHEVFRTKNDLKKRILPVLEANAIIQQHHLQYPQARIVDPAKRSSMIVEKLVAKRHRSGKSSTTSQSSPSTAAASSSKTASTAASSSSSSSSSTSTDFVWSLNHNLLPESSQHPSLTDPSLSTTLQDRLSRISSGTESVHLITSQTRAERAAVKEQYHESKILHLAQVQNVWKRPQGILNPRRYGGEAEEWVSSEEERQHLNKRRGLKRVGKERRMVRLVKILGDAYLGKEGQVPTSS